MKLVKGIAGVIGFAIPFLNQFFACSAFSSMDSKP